MGSDSASYRTVTDRGDRRDVLRNSLKNGVQSYTEVSYDSLVSLHEKLVKAIFLSRRAHVYDHNLLIPAQAISFFLFFNFYWYRRMYNRVLLKAFKYEDVEKSKANVERSPQQNRKFDRVQDTNQFEHLELYLGPLQKRELTVSAKSTIS